MSAEPRFLPEPVVLAAHDPRAEITEAVLRRVGGGLGQLPGPVQLATWEAARRHRLLGVDWWLTDAARACLAAAREEGTRDDREAVTDICWKNVEAAEMRALGVTYLSDQLFIDDN